ncbi:MAG: ABC transporter ATP-binding protein [Actinomycetota bacterium]|nr:ABC transporter ATP-binding protein [Actinomycetota bacterium]
MAGKILEIKDLKKRFPSDFLLDIKSLSINENEIFTLIGPNGSGKSTLIYLINLLMPADSGKIFFENEDILAKKINKPAVRKKMGVVFQEPLLFNTSVYNNLIMGLQLRNENVEKCKKNLDFMIKKLKLKELLGRAPRTLSGGEKQKVSLARALLLNPRILLLDEPLANIDQATKDEFSETFFKILKEKGTTTLYITHDRNEAMAISDYVGVIDSGKIAQTGPKEEVFRKPVNAKVAKFVGVETLVSGIVVNSSAGILEIKINDSKIFAVGKRNLDEKITISIRPEDVMLLSDVSEPEKLSTLNIFKGITTEIKDMGLFKKVEIDCGFALVAYITETSAKKFNLKKGSQIYAAVKATSVHLF